jgi:flagellar L-ring protein precursor FlgH
MKIIKPFLVVTFSLALAGCIVPPRSIVTLPTTPPMVAAPPPNLVAQGAIYQAGNSMMLYETRRATRVGDVLTIQLAETFTGNDTSKVDLSRDGSATVTRTDGSGTPAYLARLFNLGSSDTKFGGQGNNSSSRSMTGTLAVSVINLLPNGNLIVAGEKEVAMHGNVDILRLSGIVNPRDIDSNNNIPSNKVADARIEQAGVGAMTDATTMGWLQRQFLTRMSY